MELYTFGLNEAQLHGQRTEAAICPATPDGVIDTGNLLVQELIDTGVWLDIDLLTEAREDLREEVREVSADPNSFIAREFRVALKLVSQRLRTLQAHFSSLS